MDTFRIIGLFTKEANMEADMMMHSPYNFLNPSGDLIRSVDREGGMGLYMMTRD